MTGKRGAKEARVRLTDALVELLWVDDPRDLEKQIPRLRLVDDVQSPTMSELVTRLSKT